MSKLYRILGQRGRITIPYELRQRVGFAKDDVLSFTETEDGRSVLVRREKICDHCRSHAANESSLCAFLDELPEEQQRTALLHLSVRWAEKFKP